MREKYRLDGSYRAQVHLILTVTGAVDDVREVARSLRLISMDDSRVHAFDALTGERRTALSDELVHTEVEFDPDFVLAPFSPWERVNLAPKIARSLAVVDVNLLSPPPVGTRIRLDLTVLAKALRATTRGGTAIEFDTRSIELELVEQ